MSQTVKAFIESKGGNNAVAAATGYQPGAVALWVHRNRLPRAAWPEVLMAYADVSLRDLLALEAATTKPAVPANDDGQERAA
jgi:hypothetical protein